MSSCPTSVIGNTTFPAASRTSTRSTVPVLLVCVSILASLQRISSSSLCSGAVSSCDMLHLALCFHSLQRLQHRPHPRQFSITHLLAHAPLPHQALIHAFAQLQLALDALDLLVKRWAHPPFSAFGSSRVSMNASISH